jgi:hypothetical protein
LRELARHYRYKQIERALYFLAQQPQVIARATQAQG